MWRVQSRKPQSFHSWLGPSCGAACHLHHGAYASACSPRKSAGPGSRSAPNSRSTFPGTPPLQVCACTLRCWQAPLEKLTLLRGGRGAAPPVAPEQSATEGHPSGRSPLHLVSRLAPSMREWGSPAPATSILRPEPLRGSYSQEPKCVISQSRCSWGYFATAGFD